MIESVASASDDDAPLDESPQRALLTLSRATSFCTPSITAPKPQ